MQLPPYYAPIKAYYKLKMRAAESSQPPALTLFKIVIQLVGDGLEPLDGAVLAGHLYG